MIIFSIEEMLACQAGSVEFLVQPHPPPVKAGRMNCLA
jgi:hypothetical protein